MYGALFVATMITVLTVSSPIASAQIDLQKAKNLATCLSGRYPSLCKREWLTTEELKKVEVAEHRANLKTCMTGRYPSLCRKDKLTAEELQQVVAAEKRENLKTCLTGHYKSLCKKNLLTESERKQVIAAEQAENLRICMTGLYPSLCDRSQLTPEQLSQVQIAERQANESIHRFGPGSKRAPTGQFGLSGCESGHWVQSVSSDGQIVKLEDGSVWEVDPVDAIDSMLWLPTTEIVVCEDKLINTDDNETVSSRRIR